MTYGLIVPFSFQIQKAVVGKFLLSPHRDLFLWSKIRLSIFEDVCGDECQQDWADNSSPAVGQTLSNLRS